MLKNSYKIFTKSCMIIRGNCYIWCVNDGVMMIVRWFFAIIAVAYAKMLLYFGRERNAAVIPEGMYCYSPDIEKNKNTTEKGVYYIIRCPYYKWLSRDWNACTFCGVITNDDVFDDQVKMCNVKDPILDHTSEYEVVRINDGGIKDGGRIPFMQADPDKWAPIEQASSDFVSDLKQYVTNLLYDAYDKGGTFLLLQPDFDNWVEEQVNLIDEYFKSTQVKN